MSRSYSVSHATILARFLPNDSRLFSAITGYKSLDRDEYLLATIDMRLQTILLAIGAIKKSAIEPFSFSDIMSTKDDSGGYTIDDYERLLKRPREGV